jgi:methylthioribulose-1-phosphate dehydratase
MSSDTYSIEAEAEALCTTARWCYARGWVPATSGNFSVLDRGIARILISPSGLDKGVMTTADLLETDLEGGAVDPAKRPSAETALHVVIYRDRPDARAILHVHTVWNTMVSGIFEERGYIGLKGYELLKGLSGVTTHEYEERVPILENSQDYGVLAEEMAAALGKFEEAHGILLSRHGLYTWGKSVAEARRHLEALEFLFEVEGRRLSHNTLSS